MSRAIGKLVRDNIPDIIRAQGETPVARALAQEEYMACLKDKLREEAQEFLEEPSLGELADLVEVAEALSSAMGFSWEELLCVKQDKAQRNGKFEKRLFLEEVV